MSATDPRIVDAVGLACPQPVLDLAAAIGECEPGDLVLLRADDAAAKVDVPVWCRMKRQQLVHVEEQDGVWSFTVRAT